MKHRVLFLVLALLLLSVLHLSAPKQALACVCTQATSALDEFAQSELVFIGMVIGEDEERKTATFQVQEMFRGALRGMIVLQESSFNCGFDFSRLTVGESYLVYSSRFQIEPETQTIHKCSRTDRVSNVQYDIRLLKQAVATPDTQAADTQLIDNEPADSQPAEQHTVALTSNPFETLLPKIIIAGLIVLLAGAMAFLMHRFRARTSL